jgi:hypothetical protein
MKPTKRFVSLLLMSFALALAATPMMAACRQDTNLPISQLLDLNSSFAVRTGQKTFFLHLVVNPTQGYLCNGDGGTLPLPPGCSTDLIIYKPGFSANVAAVNPTSGCSDFNVAETNQGLVTVAFRIRYELNKRTPARQTIRLTFNLPSTFSGATMLTLSAQTVPDPVE